MLQSTDSEARGAGEGCESDPGDRPGPHGWRQALARRADLLARPAELALRLSTLAGEALPVGVLDSDGIRRAVWQAYREAPDFYDPDTYPIRYESRLLPLLERHSQGKRLLDLYCGHGREAAIFARAGYRVLGVDGQRQSVESARAYATREGFEAEFVAGDIDVWEPAARWDVVYTSLWMYSTIPDRLARVRWLRRIAGWTAPDGVLVVSVTPRAEGARGPAVRHALATAFSRITFNRRRPEIGDRFHTRLFWHDFTGEEAFEEFDAAGLSPAETLEIDGGTPCTFHALTVRAHAPL